MPTALERWQIRIVASLNSFSVFSESEIRVTKKLLLISISILLALLSACGGGGECGITPTTAAADQSIVGTANNDVLNSTQGNDTIDGLGGLNTVVYHAVAATTQLQRRQMDGL